MDRLVVPVLSPGASAAIADLCAHAGFEIIGVVVDVGGLSALDGLRDATLTAGARRCHVVDMREAVAEHACWPALAAGALGVPGPPLEYALALPAVASAIAQVAGLESAPAAAPWADDPADRQRLRALLRGLAPSLGLVAVAGKGRPSRAQSIVGCVDVVDDLATPPAPEAGPAAATFAEVRVGFVRGVPRTLNGVTLTAAEIADSLSTIVRAHGLPPLRVRAASGAGGWLVDAPAARVLHSALAHVLAERYDVATAEVAATVAERYAAVVRDGAWYTPLRRALDGFVERAVEVANAEVAVRIAGGRIEVQA